jgi:protein gp37
MCYAMHMARRLDGQGVGYDNTTRRTKQGTDWTGTVKTHDDRLDTPLRWRKPRLVFVNSMSDLFHPGIPSAFVDKVFTAMALSPDHTFQILTKRPERMSEYMDAGKTALMARWTQAAQERFDKSLNVPYPLPNVWLGTSVEDETVLERIDALRPIDATVRFLSLEPLLGEIKSLNLNRIDWVIVGGESGHSARPMEERWVTTIRDQCKSESVPFFFKQWGGRHSKANGRELDGRTWDEMPEPVATAVA